MTRLRQHASTVPLLLGAALLVGALLRLDLVRQDLFADELATYWIVSSNDLFGVVDTVSTTAEITPPLSFLLSWLATRIELGPEMLRLPALIAGVATIPLAYAVGARTVGREAGLLAAALVALSPFMVFYSAEGRGYGVMMALVLCSTLALLLALEDGGRRRWWIAYAAFVCLAAYTHYTSVFVLAAQFGWALWAVPSARRPLLFSTGAAALIYVPWLPSLKGDLDSPTTEILSALSPFTFAAVEESLTHWALGFPLVRFVPLRDLPGDAALLLVAAALLATGLGLIAARGGLRAWLAGNDRRVLLIGTLAVATPVGAALVSAVGSGIFTTRNLAASWPYLALGGAALVSVARPRALRAAAAVLALAAFALAAVATVSRDYERPRYSDVAEFVREGPGGVLVDSAVFTPGPVANFDVEGSSPGGVVLRLNRPEVSDRPFRVGDRLASPEQIARRAVAAAAGGPITVVTTAPGEPIAGGAPTEQLRAAAFIELLPPGYELVRRQVFEAVRDLEALVYAPDGGGRS